jgi:hypothetical protein
MRRRPALLFAVLTVAALLLPSEVGIAHADAPITSHAGPATAPADLQSGDAAGPVGFATRSVVALPGPAAVRMTFDAAPERATKGAAVTLTGRVWQTTRGNQARVDFYFHATGTPANAYTHQGFATTTDAWNFSRSYTAQTTGTWKAVYAGSASRRNAARLDAVQVFQRRSREVASWSDRTSSWQSPTIRIPTQDYKAIVSWNCGDGGSPFAHLTWTGEGGGSEYVRGEKTTGSLTLNGHAGARRGVFKVTTSTDCTWIVRVFSGIAAFQV